MILFFLRKFGFFFFFLSSGFSATKQTCELTLNFKWVSDQWIGKSQAKIENQQTLWATDFDYQDRSELRTHLKETAFGWKYGDMTIVTSSTPTTHGWNTSIPLPCCSSSSSFLRALEVAFVGVWRIYAQSKALAFFPRKYSQSWDFTVYITTSFPLAKNSRRNEMGSTLFTQKKNEKWAQRWSWSPCLYSIEQFFLLHRLDFIHTPSILLFAKTEITTITKYP